MVAPQRCPECGASWTNGQTCDDYFHQMLFWEVENPGDGAEVHHLMVLCYHLQHPSLYSPAGLSEARRLLAEFVERGLVVAGTTIEPIESDLFAGLQTPVEADRLARGVPVEAVYDARVKVSS